MKLNKILASVLAAIAFSTIATSAVFAEESSSEVENGLQSTFRLPTPEERAELEDPHAVYAPVMPLDILANGNQRVYGKVKITSIDSKDKYYLLGFAETVNNTTSPSTLSYQQGSTVTVNGSVSASVKASSEIEAMFVAAIKNEVGTMVSISSTISKSTSVICTITVHPGKKGRIEAYQKAAYATATLPYSDYSPSGSLLSQGTLSLSGDLVKVNVINYITTESNI